MSAMIPDEDRPLFFSILLAVIAAHLLLLFGIRSLFKPEPAVEPPGLSFVDLGMMGGGEAGSGEGNTAPPPAAPVLPPPAPVEQKPQPRPQQPPKETVRPVIRRDNAAADIRIPPETKPEPATPVKPQPIEPLKPIAPVAETAKLIQPVNTAAANTAANPSSAASGDRPAGPQGGNGQSGSGNGGNGAGSGGGSGGGSGDGGGGGGAIVGASHIGGYLNNPKPPYPPQLLEEGVGGTVKLRVMVEADGKPSSVEIVSASHPLFGRSAQQTVRDRYTFRPATRNGQPIRHSYVFSITFRPHN